MLATYAAVNATAVAVIGSLLALLLKSPPPDATIELNKVAVKAAIAAPCTVHAGIISTTGAGGGRAATAAAVDDDAIEVATADVSWW